MGHAGATTILLIGASGRADPGQPGLDQQVAAEQVAHRAVFRGSSENVTRARATDD